MSTDTNNPIADNRAKLVRHRWLWRVVILCLLLWGIKAIHHALQPQYQGKTAAEWFEDMPFNDFSISFNDYRTEVTDPTEPTLIAFKHMGPKGARYLWTEFKRNDSQLAFWLRNFWNGLKNDTLSSSAYIVRPAKAYCLLEQMGPEAEILIPDLVECLNSDESGNRSPIASLLGKIQRQPQVVMPALIKHLNTPNQDSDDYVACINALGCFGPSAAVHLPELKKCLQDHHFNEEQRIEIAAAITRISGNSTDLKRIVDDFFAKDYRNINTDIRIVSALGELGPLARELSPTLRIYVNYSGIPALSNAAAIAVQKIDPEGIYAKP